MAAKQSGSKRAAARKTGSKREPGAASKRTRTTKKAAAKKPATMPPTLAGRALVLKGGSFGLRTVGSIYYDLAPAGAQPVEAGVVLNAPQDEHPLTLAPGEYDYRFDIETGSGNIQLSVRQSSGAETQQQPFSSDAPLALHYQFKVS